MVCFSSSLECLLLPAVAGHHGAIHCLHGHPRVRYGTFGWGNAGALSACVDQIPHVGVLVEKPWTDVILAIINGGQCLVSGNNIFFSDDALIRGLFLWA